MKNGKLYAKIHTELVLFRYTHKPLYLLFLSSLMIKFASSIIAEKQFPEIWMFGKAILKVNAKYFCQNRLCTQAVRKQKQYHIIYIT